MCSGAEPQADGGNCQASGLGGRHDRARCGGAGELRRGHRGHGPAHGRPQPVGADQCGPGRCFCTCSSSCHVGICRGDRGHLEPGAQRDARVSRCRLDQHAMQIAAMRHPIGRAIALHDPGAERQARQHLPAGAVVHHDGLGHADERLQRIGKPQALQRAHAVGADLDAGAGRAELGLPLQHDRGLAALCQRDRRRQAADAAAGDQDRRI